MPSSRTIITRFTLSQKSGRLERVAPPMLQMISIRYATSLCSLSLCWSFWRRDWSVKRVWKGIIIWWWKMLTFFPLKKRLSILDILSIEDTFKINQFSLPCTQLYRNNPLTLVHISVNGTQRCLDWTSQRYPYFFNFSLVNLEKYLLYIQIYLRYWLAVVVPLQQFQITIV